MFPFSLLTAQPPLPCSHPLLPIDLYHGWPTCKKFWTLFKTSPHLYVDSRLCSPFRHHRPTLNSFLYLKYLSKNLTTCSILPRGWTAMQYSVSIFYFSWGFYYCQLSKTIVTSRGHFVYNKDLFIFILFFTSKVTRSKNTDLTDEKRSYSVEWITIVNRFSCDT